MLELVVAEREATPAIAESVRRVYLLFFQATNRLTNKGAVYSERNVANDSELAMAYHED
jgi:hypothetical protein